MSTEQSPDAENNASTPAEDMPPPPPTYQESPPPAPAPAASSVPPTSGSSAKDKKMLAGILAIVLGAYGVHKFVLGYKNEGIIMLAASVVGFLGFFVLCFPILLPIAAGVIGLIEGIMYLTKTDEEFDRIYIQGRKPWF